MSDYSKNGRFPPQGFPAAAVICLAAAFLLSGCMTVGPDYHPPTLKTPEQWSETPRNGVAEEEVPAALGRWWTLFGDSTLNSLIARASVHNKDLMIAKARIREARAQRGIAAADLYPTIGTSGAYSRYRLSENAEAGIPGERDFFEAAFDANWEIDVFGGVRRSVEAADADIGASMESLGDAMVSLFAEIARNYVELRGNQLRIRIAEDNIRSQRHTLEMTQARFQVGLSSRLDIAQAQAQLASTEAQVPSLDSMVRHAIHRIGVLLGEPPAALLDELSPMKPMAAEPPQVPVGLPSELLRRRPDIRRAERELAAATARIGVATAELFPRFFLTGAMGLQSAELSNFVRSGSGFWSIGPTVTWPLFAGGRIRSNIEVYGARQEQAMVFYEQVVLTSMEEVENALVAHAREQVARRSLAESVEANLKAVTISQELYKKGLTDFLNVLVTQRFLYQAQDALALSEQRISTNLVALFKALGGGWEIPAGANPSL